MSSPAVQLRQRVPRIAQEAVDRARLTVVPVVRTRAPRMPFVTLVTLLLVGGVVGLLLFNTSMQQASFAASTLERQAESLAARQQTLQMELDELRNPQRVAAQAQAMGMVIPANPVFLDLSTGSVRGVRTPSTPENALRLQGREPIKPAILAPKPTIVTVEAPSTPAETATEPGTTTRAGRNEAGNRGRRNQSDNPDDGQGGNSARR
jgi:type II secretory pathway pseudopilin PulG